MQPLFKYRWYLRDGYPASGITNHQCKVFGTFICGGGSSMGYKLAGYDHVGGVEIDPVIAQVYNVNHHPQYLFHQDLREFNKRQDFPAELFDLDILDGSPPCSSFSMAGKREVDWGKHKVFREGQSFQRLDDLFFDYIDLAGILRPKAVIAENVRGLINGNARAYVKDIIEGFQRIGYSVQIFLLNAASMGVPQKRERIFFICRRNDLDLPKLSLTFSCAPIPFGVIEDQVPNPIGKLVTDTIYQYWRLARPGMKLSDVHPEDNFFNSIKVSRNKVVNTIAASRASRIMHHTHPNRVSDDCLKLCGTFPMDYNFLDVDPQYLIGMSVPPVMMASIAYNVYEQWLKNLLT